MRTVPTVTATYIKLCAKLPPIKDTRHFGIHLGLGILYAIAPFGSDITMDKHILFQRHKD